MKKLILIIGLTLGLQGCILSPLDILTPKPSVEVNAQVAKNADSEKNQVKVETGKTEVKQEAESISNDTAFNAKSITQITQNIPLHYLVLMIFLAGWAIPDPSVCFKAGRAVIGDVLNCFVVIPVKGVADFILKIFKRGV